ncbi:hypothetical protein DNHGIG_27910 [Collibacillus ludicampi]|uniref:Copper amine oxidase-like N-terminal domain-containing protein n=1 Tax=Collibacillus ludicampi TaxID=2771369 RepID=A0AAV4LHE6_9BACL|nr:copper amine oxidase N-terminal domain-containing protein [Collibacillus ludicampi]GIM47242.1 hypothetical protein DNHGIG_27910 [Collibacillus ludicampi]
MSKRRKVNFLAAGLIVGSLSFCTTQAYAAENGLTISLENQKQTDVQPILVKDRTFIPLYTLADWVGAGVEYDASTHTVTCTKDEITFTIDVLQGVVKENGEQIAMDPPPRIMNGRTMVPLRYFAESFGYQVFYNASTNTVNIVPSQDVLKKREVIKDLLRKSQEATNAKNSYQMNFGLKASLPTGIVKANLTGNMQFDYNKNPFALHGKGSIDVPIQPQAQHFDIEMYLIDGKIYYLNPETHKWEKITIMSQAEWNQLIQMSTSTTMTPQQEEQINMLLPMATLKDNGNTYEIHFSLTKSALKKLIMNSPVPGSNGAVPSIPTDEELQFFKTFHIIQTIDKASSLQKGFSINMEMAIPDAGSMNITVDGTLSNFDQVPPISIPQDVLQNAVEVPVH